MTQLQTIKPKILPILHKHDIKRAGIFGSVATGNVTPNSDVDILVELGTPISLLDFVGIKLELEDALEKKVDLVEYEALKVGLKENILNEEIRIYG